MSMLDTKYADKENNLIISDEVFNQSCSINRKTSMCGYFKSKGITFADLPVNYLVASKKIHDVQINPLITAIE